MKCDATSAFCHTRVVRRQIRDEHGIPVEDELGNPRFESVREHSFQRPWRVFHAKQLCLAEEADAKIQTVKMYPPLTNVIPPDTNV